MSTLALRKSVAVQIGGPDGLKVQVREMRWHDAIDFLGMLGTHAQKLIGPIAKQAGGMDQAQIRKLVLQELVSSGPTLVLNVRELGDLLLTKSIDDASVLEELGVADSLELIRVALDLNLSAQVKEALAALGKTAAAAVGSVPK